MSNQHNFYCLFALPTGVIAKLVYSRLLNVFAITESGKWLPSTCYLLAVTRRLNYKRLVARLSTALPSQSTTSITQRGDPPR